MQVLQKINLLSNTAKNFNFLWKIIDERLLNLLEMISQASEGNTWFWGYVYDSEYKVSLFP